MSGRAPESDLLAEADHAERAGDLMTAARLVRAHLLRQGEHAPTRLRLGGLLLQLHENAAARTTLLPLEDAPDPALAARALRWLATLDEREGALTSAEVRWEKLLVDDIDDGEARTHLRALRPAETQAPTEASLAALATLVAPEGVRTARFQLVRELGRGSSATVYLVQDERLALPLALKVLHPQLAATRRSEARAAFFAEARVAARLRHAGVVAIYDVDEEARSLAMEYLPGGTVRDRLRAANAAAAAEAARATGPDARGLAMHEVLDTARSLMAALAYVHGAGVIHGDLKPGNVLLRAPGDVVLADFGGARLSEQPVEAAAGDSANHGTPLYLAPEQFRGAPVSEATDLFAAGAILWELACGRPARRPQDLLRSPALIAQRLPAEPFTPLGAAGARLRALIEALTAVAREARPRHAADALAMLG